MKYENGTHITAWLTGDKEGECAGWFKLDTKGWWNLHPSGTLLSQSDLIELAKKSLDLNQEV
jgi:hypothetical protein